MNKLNTLLIATVFSALSTQVYAEPVDNGPPAQHQKDAVPNSTESGNYLEPQTGGEVNDANKASDKHHQKTHKTNKSKNKTDGKNVTEQPKDGGVDVSPK